MDFNNWNKDKYDEFIVYLKSLSDEAYKNFNLKLINTKYEMLGIRLPMLRKIAKEISKGNYEGFLDIASNKYYEEVLLKGLVLGNIKSIDVLFKYFDSYIDLIDNWGICDSFCNSLKIIDNNKSYFLGVIDDLINSKDEYRLRVGLVLLLNFYVEEEYLSVIYKYLDKIKSDYYYVNMAMAWLLCEVFTKYNKETLKYLENNKLSSFVINKGISKIRDSYRVSKDLKDYILKYKC